VSLEGKPHATGGQRQRASAHHGVCATNLTESSQPGAPGTGAEEGLECPTGVQHEPGLAKFFAVEPITEGNRGQALDGPDLSQEEHEVVLRA